MRQAPKEPSWTLGLGHPTFKFISSYPYCYPITAAYAKRFGSQPPSCNTIGCSIGLKGSTCL